MTQQNENPQRENERAENQQNNERENTAESTAGSQAATTGYGTGQASAQGTAPAHAGKDTPSNAGDAGFKSTEAGQVSEERQEQMSHADGSNEDHNPDV